MLTTLIALNRQLIAGTLAISKQLPVVSFLCSHHGVFSWQLPKLLQGPFIAAVEKGNIRSMPNKIMPALPYPTPGALLMGDAFNMRHPLTGGGMTVALADIVLLRNMLRPLRSFYDQSAVCNYLQAFYTRRKVWHLD